MTDLQLSPPARGQNDDPLVWAPSDAASRALLKRGYGCRVTAKPFGKKWARVRLSVLRENVTPTFDEFVYTLSLTIGRDESRGDLDAAWSELADSADRYLERFVQERREVFGDDA